VEEGLGNVAGVAQVLKNLHIEARVVKSVEGLQLSGRKVAGCVVLCSQQAAGKLGNSSAARLLPLAEEVGVACVAEVALTGARELFSERFALRNWGSER
jgi:hypothetical protein